MLFDYQNLMLGVTAVSTAGTLLYHWIKERRNSMPILSCYTSTRTANTFSVTLTITSDIPCVIKRVVVTDCDILFNEEFRPAWLTPIVVLPTGIPTSHRDPCHVGVDSSVNNEPMRLRFALRPRRPAPYYRLIASRYSCPLLDYLLPGYKTELYIQPPKFFRELIPTKKPQ